MPQYRTVVKRREEKRRGYKVQVITYGGGGGVSFSFFICPFFGGGRKVGIFHRYRMIQVPSTRI